MILHQYNDVLSWQLLREILLFSHPFFWKDLVALTLTEIPATGKNYLSLSLFLLLDLLRLKHDYYHPLHIPPASIPDGDTHDPLTQGSHLPTLGRPQSWGTRDRVHYVLFLQWWYIYSIRSEEAWYDYCTDWF